MLQQTPNSEPLNPIRFLLPPYGKAVFDPPKPEKPEILSPAADAQESEAEEAARKRQARDLLSRRARGASILAPREEEATPGVRKRLLGE